MAYALTWLADVLRAAGLNVAEQPGWKERGRGDVGEIKGVICHHTAGPPTGNMPCLDVVTNGRTGANALAGPLSQLCLGRDGTFYVVAAGRANHAGAGRCWAGDWYAGSPWFHGAPRGARRGAIARGYAARRSHRGASLKTNVRQAFRPDDVTQQVRLESRTYRKEHVHEEQAQTR